MISPAARAFVGRRRWRMREVLVLLSAPLMLGGLSAASGGGDGGNSISRGWMARLRMQLPANAGGEGGGGDFGNVRGRRGGGGWSTTGGASTKTRRMAAWVLHDGKFWRSDETEGRIHIARPEVDWDSDEGVVEVRCGASLPLFLNLAFALVCSHGCLVVHARAIVPMFDETVSASASLQVYVSIFVYVYTHCVFFILRCVFKCT